MEQQQIQNELITTQAECYRLSKANQEFQAILQQLMQKCGATTLQALFDAVPEKAPEVVEEPKFKKGK